MPAPQLSAWLKAFFTVARLGSFTQAARQLGLSQPTVTAQIRALEAEYGIELFFRGGKRLALSDAGRDLMPKVLDLVSRETDIDFFLRSSADMGGVLRIGSTGPCYVMKVIERFGRNHPKVGMEVTAGNSVQMLDALDEYRVDIASSSRYIDEPRFLRVELVSNPLVLVVHADHPLAKRKTVSVSAMAHSRLLLRETGSVTRTTIEHMLADAGIKPESVLELGSREAILEAIALNMGVSAIPRQEVPAYGNFHTLAFSDAAPAMSEYLYCLNERRDARLIATFVAEASAVYKTG
jgi:LysR family transcriptional regulator, low CO2-responsive transcriptional regulator